MKVVNPDRVGIDFNIGKNGLILGMVAEPDLSAVKDRVPAENNSAELGTDPVGKHRFAVYPVNVVPVYHIQGVQPQRPCSFL